jgi:hypothetical protein
MRKEQINSHACDSSARRVERLPFRIHDLPRVAERRALDVLNYRFTCAISGPRAWRYSGVGLGLLAYDFPAGCETQDVRASTLSQRVKALLRTGRLFASKFFAGFHWSKLQHRAPLEIPANLSHVRKTLESGIPVPPSATSLDDVGQWPLCCAGASPTEGPKNC